MKEALTREAILVGFILMGLAAMSLGYLLYILVLKLSGRPSENNKIFIGLSVMYLGLLALLVFF